SLRVRRRKFCPSEPMTYSSTSDTTFFVPSRLLWNTNQRPSGDQRGWPNPNRTISLVSCCIDVPSGRITYSCQSVNIDSPSRVETTTMCFPSGDQAGLSVVRPGGVVVKRRTDEPSTCIV